MANLVCFRDLAKDSSQKTTERLNEKLASIDNCTVYDNILWFGYDIRKDISNGFLSVTDLQNCATRSNNMRGFYTIRVEDIFRKESFIRNIYYLLLKKNSFYPYSFYEFMDNVRVRGCIRILKDDGLYICKGRGENRVVFCDKDIWILLAIEFTPRILVDFIFKNENINDLFDRYSFPDEFDISFNDIDRRGKDVFTYLAKGGNENIVKIGKTIDLKSRESCMRNSNHELRIIAYLNKDIEKELHDCYSDKHIIREWYALDINDVNSIIRKYGFNIK